MSCDKSNLVDVIRKKKWSKARSILEDALREACAHDDTPTSLVKSLLAACPPSAPSRKDDFGETALHTAVMWSSSEIILTIIDACPRAVFTRNSEGDTPLHLALYHARSPEIVQRLLDVHPGAIAAVNDDGLTPLEEFFLHWNVGLRGLIESSSLAADSLPMSLAALLDTSISSWNGASDAKIQHIYDITVSLLQRTTTALSSHDNGTIPKPPASPTNGFQTLHSTLNLHICPWSFFHLILKLHPHQATQPDNKGTTLGHNNLPLHIAAGTTQSSYDNDMYFCYECKSQKNDEEPFYKNKSGIDAYCQECFVTGAFMDGLHAANDYVPLNPVEKIATAIDDLLALYPAAANIPNQRGRLPLHIAIETNKPFETIKNILFAAPRAVRIRDEVTCLLPFMLAAVKQKRETGGMEGSLQQVNTVFLLLREDPSLVSWGIDNSVYLCV